MSRDIIKIKIKNNKGATFNAIFVEKKLLINIFFSGVILKDFKRSSFGLGSLR